MEAATFHYLSGDLDRSNRILEQLLHEVPHGAERADLLYALLITARIDVVDGARLCQEALAEVPADDVRCARILSILSQYQLELGRVPAAVESARASVDRAEQTLDDGLVMIALTRLAQTEDMALCLTPGLFERAMEIEEGLGAHLAYHESPKFQYACVMQHRDLLDRSREIMEEFDAAARAAGDELSCQFVALNVTPLEWYAGRWERAQELVDIALEFAQQSQQPFYWGMLEKYRALIEADLGLLDQARQSAEEGIRWGRPVSDEVGMIGNVAVLGRVELLAGDLQAAGTHLRDLPERLLSAGWLGPDSVDVWPDSIETLIRLGELGRARAYLDTFEELAPQASRRWVAGAARCRGLFAAAERDFDAAFDHFDRALSELEAVGCYPLDRGRTLLALGSVRRQAGQKAPARAALDDAVTSFDNLGARAWSSWAVAELGRISGRRAATHDLTEAELRVATLASQGLSNREIAATLFMGVTTVETHLTRVYGKLGVRRAGLAMGLQNM